MGVVMTDEERKKLCEALRGERAWPGALAKMMPDAADEIKRLATELRYLRDQCIKAEGAMLQIQRISSDYTRQIIESECEYGKPND
jgi:hypothetical protein